MMPTFAVQGIEPAIPLDTIHIIFLGSSKAKSCTMHDQSQADVKFKVNIHSNPILAATQIHV